MDKLKNDLKEQFLDAKKVKLVSMLVDFIENKAPQLISNPDDLKVLTFEHDHPPFEFNYIGYPDPNIIAQDYWLTQFTIEAGETEDKNKLTEILANNDIVEQEYLTWINTKTGEDIEMCEIYSELEDVFFAECWQIAKKKTNSGYRCFFLQHDVYRGIDADTRQNTDGENIIEILTTEGFEFKIFDTPKTVETKSKTRPWWGLW